MINSFRFDQYFFQSEESSALDFSELMASYFPFDLLGVVLRPTMLEVISGYSISENDLFLRERRLMAELEGGATDNHFMTDGLLV